MTINPRDYDLGELRDAIEGSADSASDDSEDSHRTDNRERGSERGRNRGRRSESTDRRQGDDLDRAEHRRDDPDRAEHRRDDPGRRQADGATGGAANDPGSVDTPPNEPVSDDRNNSPAHDRQSGGDTRRGSRDAPNRSPTGAEQHDQSRREDAKGTERQSRQSSPADEHPADYMRQGGDPEPEPRRDSRRGAQAQNRSGRADRNQAPPAQERDGHTERHPQSNTPRARESPEESRSRRPSQGDGQDPHPKSGPEHEAHSQQPPRESRQPQTDTRQHEEPASQPRTETTPEPNREQTPQEPTAAEQSEFSFGAHGAGESQQQEKRGAGEQSRQETSRQQNADQTGSRGIGSRFGGGGHSSPFGGQAGGEGRPSFGPAGQQRAASRPGVGSGIGDRSAAFQELSSLQRLAPRGQTDKPYLGRIPDAYEMQVSMMQWIESLIIKAGRERTLDALSYYRSIGWITGEVERTLKEHARTIAESTTNGSVELTMEDHRESLTVIAQLANARRSRAPRAPPRRQR